ncbi:MAG TPA: acetyl-CoA decarbonylase/synthase complex subunit alpha/beta [Oscillospiraceae bacterium]|nr:acetyl-CoA decarbonylase/synthase complex subunit alpha/beta [Oscillospiraceae bacterium]HPS34786.1 acetyl-CoA decarbonylase/synthase complex subunit alpha/beta [Oscillospiraceae bacterium]
MSKLICTNAIDGAVEWVVKAEMMVQKAIAEKGENCPVTFPDTNYYLPVIYSFTGKKMQTLSDLREILKEARELLPARPADNVWLPYLGNTLDAGVATLFACEVIEACKYIIGPNPVNGIWLGAASDVIMRERGIEFVDGTAPGFAAITGAAPDNATAVRIAKELQQKNLYVFMAGSTNGKQFAEQLAEEGVQLGWETRLVPFGSDVSALIYALGFANRAALSFGGVKPGDFAANLKYNKNRIFAFVLAFGEVTPDKYAAAAGALNYGFPVIADTDIPEILPTGICTYEHVVSNVPYDQMVTKALEVRGCKIKVVDVPVPVPYGPAFEGERIRKGNVHAEFGGNKSPCFEFVTSVETDQINDNDIQVIGPDLDSVEPGTILPLAIWVEVAGRKMQTDFEPILERQIHHLVNGAEGIWHMGQRDIVWTRVSKDGYAKGLRLRHYGDILHARFLADYPAIVDKVKVTLITDQAEVEKRLKIARKVYDERNRRLEAMTDESVDTFYSCLLCQSFAPNHVCVITPERLGLCGAYNWLDGKAAYEIDETGPNQPLKKGECLDARKGVWKGINEFVYTNSHKTVDSFCAYSLMDHPMTSCGCFEAIVAFVPECNGLMVVNREFPGDTPVGMTFSTLAGSVGGGQQTPGFIGCGKMFLTSKKFIAAEGGFKRLVWMPKELKELLKNDLMQRFTEIGMPELYDMIADETVATNAEEVRAYMEKVKHPALSMEDMRIYLESSEEAEATAAPTEQAAAPAAETPGAAENKSAEKPTPAVTAAAVAQVDIEAIKAQLADEVRASVTKDVVSSIIDVLAEKFLGKAAAIPVIQQEAPKPAEAAAPKVSAAQRISEIKSLAVRKEKCELPIHTVKLGNTKAEGGTRTKTYTIGGETCMPFHLWEGEMPNRPLVAMEVFDTVSAKYPEALREIFKDVLHDPAAMAKLCVEKYGADLISVRLDGTHPERGNKSAQEAVELVQSVLKSVGVPLIITGHNHYEKNNEVMKAIAQACEGENLLLNWVEQDNYRTIAGAAIAYGHTLVSQSPIDVNISKQLNILLTNMDMKPDRIVVDPMTSAIGYGIEYSYSVMERIRQSGLGGDKMLCSPLIVSPGYECTKLKECKAPEENFPMWGSLSDRAVMWEMSTSLSLLYAGADVLIMYHPEAVREVKKAISELLDGRETSFSGGN